MRVVLPIKKVYFDLIKSGVKTKEYRNNTAFYQKRFNKNVDEICFHYYKSEKLIKKITGIKLIPRPKNLDVLTTDEVFEISLA